MSARSDGFFRWVWRINGVLLLGLCLAGLTAVVGLNAFGGTLFSGSEPEPQITDVAGADISAANLSLGGFQPVVGTQLLYADLSENADGKLDMSSYSRGTARNILFFDAATKKVHWLIKGNSQRIPGAHFITNEASIDCAGAQTNECQRRVATVAILLEIAPVESGAQSQPASRRLMIAAPDGTGLVTVVDGLDRLLGRHTTASATLLAFYSKSGVARVVEVDMSLRKVLADNALSDRQ